MKVAILSVAVVSLLGCTHYYQPIHTDSPNKVQVEKYEHCTVAYRSQQSPNGTLLPSRATVYTVGSRFQADFMTSSKTRLVLSSPDIPASKQGAFSANHHWFYRLSALPKQHSKAFSVMTELDSALPTIFTLTCLTRLKQSATVDFLPSGNYIINNQLKPVSFDKAVMINE